MSAQGANLNPILLYLQSVGASAQVIMLWRLCVLGGRGERGGGGDWERTGGREREKRKLEKETGKKMARSPRRLSSRFFFIARRRSSASLSLSLSLSLSFDSNSRCAHDAALLCSVAFCLSLSHRFVFFLCSFSLRFPSLSSSSAPLPVTLPPPSTHRIKSRKDSRSPRSL